MTEDTGAARLPPWIGDELATRFRQVLDSMCGTPPEVHWVEAAGGEESAPEDGETLILCQPLTAAEGAEVFVSSPPQAWKEIGSSVLQAAGLEHPESDDIRSTYLEVISQVLSTVARSIGARIGKEVECRTIRQEPNAPAGLAAEVLRIRLGEKELPPLTILFSAPLAAILTPSSAEMSAAGEAECADVPDRRRSQQHSSEDPSETIDLLLEVELPVGVSFGRTQLALKDVIKLSTGSIVELNRTITEPVEVIINNCVIARGEVVVVEGNYGVRIREIVSPEERLRSLY